ncbi:MAG: acyl-CoA dehydrogenase, putative phosphotransferase [uncultured Blastococcus sp.]|uniref:Acyl-CoA dehydrogenase, putative phosphotransferase n=1 Tax=uncultured Blastococcus sp. TaxID=217144 RepID=A0A6J4HYE7_9ACTN|nr:MAG: acyl-CoA dehydrogenase, putative phosphotransferase [uncultured Blastococcus sp.]
MSEPPTVLPEDTAFPEDTVLPEDAWLRDWLAAEGLQVGPARTVTRIGGGHSNLTYGLSDGSGRTWVLRRPPPGELLASAHDVVREARVMRALEETDVPVPAILSVRPDDHGVPWVLIQHIDGQVIDSMAAGQGLDPALRQAVGPSMARTLARIHAVDVDEVGLGDLASRAPYAARQLRRWARQWEASYTRPLPELDRLTARLSAAVPEQHEVRLVHGDFHIKNVITRDGSVIAVLDWELSTLGDPLADVGTLLAYWPHAGELQAGDKASVSTLPGYATREELVREYAAASGRDVSTVGFWHVLGLWKVAIIAEGVLRRAVEQPGARSPAGTPSAEDVASLVDYAHRIADDSRI